MKTYAIIFIILRCYVSTESVEDYYWRDFKGLVPTDAIPCNSESEDTAYIGQFTVAAEYNTDVSNIHTLVATIYKGQQRAIAPYNGRAVYSNETSNLKILCSGNSYRYTWKNKKSVFAPNCRFVIGGLEDNVPLYIGRGNKGKEKMTGKVFSDTSFHDDKLIVPHQGGEEKFDNYELLTFCT